METYLVGGAVRDQLLGLDVKDRDWVVVGATPEAMKAQGFKAVGSDFPVFLHPDTGEEYALARTERKSGRGYTGFTFHASPDVTLEQDLQRRDLTINAIAQDLQGRIHDPCQGRADLDARILRHVSPAFVEDPLRVLRVARFYARFAHLGFTLAPETRQLLEEISAGDELEHLTPERVWQECERALCTRSPVCFFRLLREVGALARLMPASELLDLTRLESRFEAADTLDSEQGFALLTYTLTEQLSTEAALKQIRELCTHWRTPNRYRDLALNTRSELDALVDMDGLEAERRLEVLKNLSLLRQPDRLDHLLPLVSAVAPERDTAALAQATRTLLDRIGAVDNRALQAQGFSGKALGDAIRAQQLVCCEYYRETPL
ncbi:hypothetical protein H9C73_08785 [Marinobacterium sp. AK62]|uniref:CCA tRNA nucleotidyltransferase n=1 Tax=Marinobacterium alkalitolerans TaxID=1542925 RepID=A0ABS3ZAV3_9GAMM|nr:hypothetical protein [Marinobacterium alkalitolerans]MBP0048832.1 hypothetical protein [Marinobacterium alkalitolerans]